MASHHWYVQPVVAIYISFGVGYCLHPQQRQCEKPHFRIKTISSHTFSIKKRFVREFGGIKVMLMEEESIKSQERKIKPEIIPILLEIEKHWKSLQEEPEGKLVGTCGTHLPPNEMSYWRELEKLEEQLSLLEAETSMNFGMFRHTKSKEGEYVKDFKCDNRKSQGKNNEYLSSLMRKANKQIRIDISEVIDMIETFKLNTNEES